VIYRHNLLEHFDWLSDSKYLDEMLDESVIAIAFCARGHDELINWGASWMTTRGFVEKFALEPFVERARSELLLPPRGDS
jgi:hypothetical protein